jgi:AraC-like DNA-binding protein
VLLSRNYPPTSSLAPFIRRHYVFEADLPSDYEMVDRLLAETAFVRILLRGDWEGEETPGKWKPFKGVFLFGANTRPMPVRVRGPFKVVGFSIKPGGWRALFEQFAADYVDKITPLSDAWPELVPSLLAETEAAVDDKRIVAAMENMLQQQLKTRWKPREELLISKFEAMARFDSTLRIDQISERLGLSVRQMERRCLSSFGHSPKLVMRRSRFLDMAAAMRGFSTQSEAELALFRYFDQSHLNREFKRFAGSTPGAFRRADTPLFTAGLKLRSEGEELFKLN